MGGVLDTISQAWWRKYDCALGLLKDAISTQQRESLTRNAVTPFYYTSTVMTYHVEGTYARSIYGGISQVIF